MISIIKSTLKVILRNKVFWFFVIIAPLVSTLILKNKQNYSSFYDKDRREIIELESMEDKVVYNGGNGEYLLKVYDATDSALSEYLLNRLNEKGLFKVCRYKDSNITLEWVNRQLADGDYFDRIGTVIFLDKDFDKNVLSANYKEAIKLFVMSDDERYDLLEYSIKGILQEISLCVNDKSTEKDLGKIEEKLQDNRDGIIEKEIVSYVGKNERELTTEQSNAKAQVGYAFAILTLGFLFVGIIVSHTAIAEQKNRVFTRIRLTKTTEVQYFVGKFIVGVLASMLLTVFMAIYMVAFNVAGMGMSRVKILLMIMLMGLIFSTLSLMIGIVSRNVMTANVLAFLVWNVSSLLSGLYFPLKDAGNGIKLVSNVMPQKWFLEATEMFFVNDNKVYSVLLCITVAYLIVVISLGSLGLKLVKEDE